MLKMAYLEWHSGMFLEVMFRCENVGRQRDFVIFLTFSPMNWVFFQLNWVSVPFLSQLSWKMTQFMCENVKNLPNRVVGRRFQNETKCRPTACFCKFKTFSLINWVFFQTQLSFCAFIKSNELKKDSIHVWKCQKFAKSRCRPTFSKWNKTSGNIPLCVEWRLKSSWVVSWMEQFCSSRLSKLGQAWNIWLMVPLSVTCSTWTSLSWSKFEPNFCSRLVCKNPPQVCKLCRCLNSISSSNIWYLKQSGS